MALIGTPENSGNVLTFTGVAGVNDDDVVIETEDISMYDTFEISSTTGVMDVKVSHDGGSTFVGPRSMSDLGATTLDPVVETVAGRPYAFRGKFLAIQISQKGATAVAGAVLVCGKA